MVGKERFLNIDDEERLFCLSKISVRRFGVELASDSL